LPPHSRSLPPAPPRVSLPPWPRIRSAPPPPVTVSVSLPPDRTVSWTMLVACPPLTVMVTTAVPVRPATALAATVRAAPLPAKAMLPFGTSVLLPEEALSISAVAALSTSPTVRLIVPEWSSVPHVPPAATVTAGGSLTVLTVMVTVARLEVRVPSLAR